MNAIAINVKRTGTELAPDPTRVLLRAFTPGDVPRLERIVTGIMSISESDVGPLLDAISAKFSGRHQQIGQLFKERFRQLREVVSLDQDLSEQRQLLIGAYFVSEFSVESAALFNPSMVADPDQQGLPPGALRFVLACAPPGMAAFPPSCSGQASSMPITGSRPGLPLAVSWSRAESPTPFMRSHSSNGRFSNLG